MFVSDFSTFFSEANIMLYVFILYADDYGWFYGCIYIINDICAGAKPGAFSNYCLVKSVMFEFNGIYYE